MNSLVVGKKEAQIPTTIGRYEILRSLGKGGMGEVFLAKDPAFGRTVALKRIRPDLAKNGTIRSRFLREAKVASSLTHPSIVPIFEIDPKPPHIYYTMPYVEGETLRQIIRTSRDEEKEGQVKHPIGRSIPALARIFLQVCEAVAYTHAKGVIHRDLKPENIIIGKFGEVMILDWGIADFLESLEGDEALPETHGQNSEENLTKPGKITGTLAYMAPERLKGVPSSIQTDLYALGVILYQLLTLQLPFQRKTIANFRKMADAEEILDPIEIAPYREIPHPLAAIALKCLAKDPSKRFGAVEELIREIKNTIEGKSEWILAANLQLNVAEDWQFQEHILLPKRLAISNNFDVTQWAALSLSKMAFAENLRIEAEVKLKPKSLGVGFLLNVPAPEEVESLEEGYSLWIGSETKPGISLFRNCVQVMHLPKAALKSKGWHHIALEKVDDHLRFFLDGELKITFSSHLPLPGNHVGFLSKDESFELRNFQVYDSSHNVMVGCLTVPNAFLSRHLYDAALQEYRRIGQSFPGRMEGREALFRAGITLLEKGKSEPNKQERERYFHLALKEFERLYRTPGAPLEYLGKSLVYATLNDWEEEAKCLELALRKFPKHPLLPILKEHVLYRMHESSLNNREAAYRIILLAIRHIPDLLDLGDTKDLLESLESNWEPLPFIENASDTHFLLSLSIALSFWLAKPQFLQEIGNHLLSQEPFPEIPFFNLLHCLLELDTIDIAEELFQKKPKQKVSSDRSIGFQISLLAAKGKIEEAATSYQKNSKLSGFAKFRALYFLLLQAIHKNRMDLVESFLPADLQNPEEQARLEALKLWSLLLKKDLSQAKNCIDRWPKKALLQETSPLHFPYGCFLNLTKGTKASNLHFQSVPEMPHPWTSSLPSLFLTGRFEERLEQAFWWEKKELHRQIELFYKLVGKTNSKKSN